MHSSTQCASGRSELHTLQVTINMQVSEWVKDSHYESDLQEGRTEEEGGGKVIIEKGGVSGEGRRSSNFLRITGIIDNLE